MALGNAWRLLMVLLVTLTAGPALGAEMNAAAIGQIVGEKAPPK